MLPCISAVPVLVRRRPLPPRLIWVSLGVYGLGVGATGAVRIVHGHRKTFSGQWGSSLFESVLSCVVLQNRGIRMICECLDPAGQ